MAGTKAKQPKPKPIDPSIAEIVGELPAFSTVREVAAFTGTKDDTVYRDIEAGRLRVVRIGKGRCIRIMRSEVARYIAARMTKTENAA